MTMFYFSITHFISKKIMSKSPEKKVRAGGIMPLVLYVVITVSLLVVIKLLIG